MRIAYVTPYDFNSRKGWSGNHYTGMYGSCYYLASAFISAGLKLEGFQTAEIGRLPSSFKLAVPPSEQKFYNRRGSMYPFWFDRNFIKEVGKMLSQDIRKCSASIDLVFTPFHALSLAFLDTPHPTAVFTDAPWAAILSEYGFDKNISRSVKQSIISMERDVFQKCSMVAFNSPWAKKFACDYYKLREDKVVVIPPGPSLSQNYSRRQILETIESKKSGSLILLIVSSDWKRKGGDFAVKVATELNKSGYKTELRILGRNDHLPRHLPSFVKVLNYIPKSSLRNEARIAHEFTQAHFIVVPTKSEAFGLFIPEANMHGVPVLTMDVGGTSFGVRKDVNGKAFPQTAKPSDFSNYILRYMKDPRKYKALAMSSYGEFQNRLNWELAATNLNRIFRSVI